MIVMIPPVEISLTPEEKDTLKEAHSIIEEICGYAEDYGTLNCILDGTEISHEELSGLLDSFESIF